MKNSLSLTLICILASGALLAQDAGPGPSGTSIDSRVAGRDAAIDGGRYQQLQQRIDTLRQRQAGIGSDYALAKAQCWLSSAFHERTRNDRGGYPAAAYEQSGQLVGTLEQDGDPGMDTPLVNGAVKLRDDLWARFDVLKSGEGLRCAAQATACAEVALVRAGNEMHDGGWRHANPYVRIAELLATQANAAETACVTPAEPTAKVEAPERFDVEADALFAFDRSDLDGLLPGGRGHLDAAASAIRADATVRAVRVIGHTDRLGSDAYNQALSERRAATVKSYLQTRGVRLPIEAIGVGERQPSGMTGDCSGERATAALTQCLQPDRRISIQLDRTTP